MKTKLRNIPVIAGISLIVASLLVGQSIDERLQFTTKTQSPVHEIYLALEGKYHWPLTYEEAPVFVADELTTIKAPTGMTTFIRRVSPMSVDLSSEELSAIGKARLGVINSLLAAYTKSGNSGSFRAIQDEQLIHIIPSTVRGADGKIQQFEPVLDTKISFREQHFLTVYDFLDQVLKQVSQKRGIPIVLGTTPTNLFVQTWVYAGAKDEPARDVLSRAFRDINGPRVAEGMDPIALVWGMLYDSTDRQYWFNMHVLPIELPGKAKQTALPSIPPQGATSSPNRRPHAVRRAN